MYEPHRPYPFAALLVLCLALCADSALAGATGGWGEGAGPAQPDNPAQPPKPRQCTVYESNHGVTRYTPEGMCKALESVIFDRLYFGKYKRVDAKNNICFFDVYKKSDGSFHAETRYSFRSSQGSCPDTLPSEDIKPPESGGGGDFGGGGASDSWEEDPKKPDEDKKDPEEKPKDPDPDFGDLGDIPKPPVPPASEPPGVKPPSGGGGVAINIPEPCTGAAAGTVGCMKPGEPTGEKPKTKDVKVPTQAERPVSNIKGCPDPKYFYLWNERYEISYDQFCAQAPLIKPYVIFSATLSAFFITLSAFRRK